MGSLTTMGTAVSALLANRAALNTTAHNLTNVNTKGYVRQQQLMNDASYHHIGHSGTSFMSVGLGTDVETIRQVRDIFLDKAYRGEVGREKFYEAKAVAMEEMESILGEVNGETYSEVINDFWVSLNELSKHPEGTEARASFVQSASKFAQRTNLVMKNMVDYQANIDADIKTNVLRINQIGEKICELNEKISRYEINGGNANDLRDTRNLLLDELGGIIKIKYREEADGTVLVSAENTQFIMRDNYYKMEWTAADPKSSLITPYWPHLDRKVFDDTYEVSGNTDNDIGALKGMVVARGSRRTNYLDLKDENAYNAIKKSDVMVAMATFDRFVHEVVTLVNDRLSPIDKATGELDANAPFGLNGEQGAELFSRQYVKRFDAAGKYIEEDGTHGNTLYSAGNLVINSEVLDNYGALPISKQKGFDGDNSIVKKIIDAWNGDKDEDGNQNVITLKPGLTTRLNIRDFYTAYVGDIGSKGRLASSERDNQHLMVTQIDNQRDQLMGVSSDEELGNMLKYQHAYNAASRLISVVDSMMDKVVNNLGLVGR